MLAKGSEPWLITALSLSILFELIYQMSENLYFQGAALLGGILTLFMLIFFRDPERTVEISDTYMVSPADGTVIDIWDNKICIFMFLQNVHVNRAPISGTIKEIIYKKGGYFPAFCKESERNERNEFIIHSKYGDVCVTQIAGTIARRIVSYSRVNDIVEQGQRIGMIRLGSRVDVTIPNGFKIRVRKGERVTAGKTIIATTNKEEQQQ